MSFPSQQKVPIHKHNFAHLKEDYIYGSGATNGDSSSSSNDVVFNYSLSDGYAVGGIFEKIRITHGLNHSYSEQKTVEIPDKMPQEDLFFSQVGQKNHLALYAVNDGVFHVQLVNNNITVTGASDTPEKAKKIAQKYLTKFDKLASKEEDKIYMNFWSLSPHGAQKVARELYVPTWEEIQGNYSNTTNDELRRLFDPEFKPGHGGQLILWQGEPGTGKTTAIRALAREWRTWASFQYIADPDRFFGTDANYMLNVLLTQEWNEEDYDYFSPSRNEDSEPKWGILVLEDCGELLKPDAKASAGQGLSRFLNCVDGLIGQGMKTIVLVTTNEPLKELHPAVQRPGRTASRIEFSKLSPEESSQWLGRDVSKSYTIAELYAERNEFIEKGNNKKQIGFG